MCMTDPEHLDDFMTTAVEKRVGVIAMKVTGRNQLLRRHPITTGSITLATGLTRSLDGNWRNDALTVVWSEPVRLSEATFFINGAIARSETLLRGEYVDGVQFLHRDVDIVRVGNDE
jgi:hypothetical protein